MNGMSIEFRYFVAVGLQGDNSYDFARVQKSPDFQHNNSHYLTMMMMMMIIIIIIIIRRRRRRRKRNFL